MLRGMSARQFNEWRAYADLEPFDEVRADYRAAQVVQVLLNTYRKKGKAPVRLEECLLHFGEPENQPRSPEQARAEIRKTMDLLMLIFNSPEGSTARSRRDS
jgi:hypothetical protein